MLDDALVDRVDGARDERDGIEALLPAQLREGALAARVERELDEVERDRLLRVLRPEQVA